MRRAVIPGMTGKCKKKKGEQKVRKNQRSLMKRCTVAVVSVSTVLPSIAPAMTVLADELDQDADLDGSSDESVKKSADADQEPDEDVTDKVIKKATKSEADGKTDDELEVDEDGNPEDGDLNDDINASNESKAEEETPDQTLDDITLSGKDFGEYPEFGSEDFVKWLRHPMKKLRNGMRQQSLQKARTRQLTPKQPRPNPRQKCRRSEQTHSGHGCMRMLPRWWTANGCMTWTRS